MRAPPVVHQEEEFGHRSDEDDPPPPEPDDPDPLPEDKPPRPQRPDLAGDALQAGLAELSQLMQDMPTRLAGLSRIEFKICPRWGKNTLVKSGVPCDYMRSTFRTATGKTFAQDFFGFLSKDFKTTEFFGVDGQQSWLGLSQTKCSISTTCGLMRDRTDPIASTDTTPLAGRSHLISQN